jgi:hypothetical protein
MDRMIIAKHTVGFRPTHNKDGKFLRVWRLWNDGIIERTNSRSKYRPTSDTPPQVIVDAAKLAGVTLVG